MAELVKTSAIEAQKNDIPDWLQSKIQEVIQREIEIEKENLFYKKIVD